MEYEIAKGKWGTQLTLKSPWKNDFYTLIKKNHITELILNYANGWKGDKIDFIEKLEDLKVFDITDWKIDDISPLNKLHNLRSLDVSTYCKTEIDFSNFPYLEEIAIDWRPKAKSIYECTSLKKIFISRYTGNELTPFNKITQLESFRMKSTRVKQIGQFCPPRLEELEITLGRGFETLEGLEKLTSLKKLVIDTCRKIKEIEEIKTLTKLERLEFSNNGKIASLSPLNELKKLREFFFSETTEIDDGDLSVLENLPQLEKINFTPRKHYNRNWEDFPELTRFMTGG